ncbi:hypothetical protein [Xanthomonas translucens]|uniref:hypothetical protein n=1 Tax=Xanthomonas campestris pv. translucens TaxID=343 RepID=UPI000ACF88E0|nr:hypothetical protein [Xanthomonas translucens]
MEEDQAVKRQTLYSKATTWWSRRKPAVQLYLGGTAFLLTSIALFTISPKSLSAEVAIYSSCILFASSFLREAYTTIIPKLNEPIVKLTVTVIGVVALSTATGISRITVNEATGQDATHFPSTLALLVPFSFVPVLAALVTILGAAAIVLGFLWTLTKALVKRSMPSDLDFLLNLARVFAGFIIVIAAASVLDNSSFIYPATRWVASHSAFSLDLQDDPACAPAKGDRVTRINDGLVIVGRVTESGLQFVRRACPLQAETTVLAPPKAQAEVRKSSSQRTVRE